MIERHYELSTENIIMEDFFYDDHIEQADLTKNVKLPKYDEDTVYGDPHDDQE